MLVHIAILFYFLTFLLFYFYSSFYLCVDHDTLGLHLTEVVHNEEPGVVAGILWSHAVLAVEECRHTVVALQHIVERGDTVFSLRVDLLTVESGRNEFSFTTVHLDDKLDAFADALASPIGYSISFSPVRVVKQILFSKGATSSTSP